MSAKLLLVDDDPDLLKLLSMRLTAAGYHVTAVGSAIGGLVNVLDPHVVVVGGGVSGAGDLWWGALRDAFRLEALPSLVDIPVVPSTLGNDAALIGAGALAWVSDSDRRGAPSSPL